MRFRGWTEAERKRQEAADEARLAACRGGTEVITRLPSGRRTARVPLNRPVADVVEDVVFAQGDFVHIDDGLGAMAIIKVDEVVSIRPLD